MNERPRPKSHLAAALVRQTGCTVAHAARVHDCSQGSVRRVLKRPPSDLPTPKVVKVPDQKRVNAQLTWHQVARAMAFMRNHGTTARKAAAVYGVNPQAICDMHNQRYGTRMMLVGPPIWTGWVWP